MTKLYQMLVKLKYKLQDDQKTKISVEIIQITTIRRMKKTSIEVTIC
jgi:hypothetical protein